METGGLVTVTDAKLARDLHEMSEAGPAVIKSKRTGMTQVKKLFARDDGCAYICGQGECNENRDANGACADHILFC